MRSRPLDHERRFYQRPGDLGVQRLGVCGEVRFRNVLCNLHSNLSADHFRLRGGRRLQRSGTARDVMMSGRLCMRRRPIPHIWTNRVRKPCEGEV